MKLGKLLAASTSIMKGQMDVSYRSSKQIYLPKFVSPKNPFQAQAPQSAGETVSEADSPAVSEETSKPAVAPSSEQDLAPRPTRLAPPETPVAAPIKTVAAKTQKIPLSISQKKSGWAGKFSPQSIFKAVAKADPGTTGKTQKPMETQTELSLDSVRVVHNDLSDVDVEVVPMKSRSAPPEMKPAKKSWEILGERLFGVEAS
jgi:hypothetical protein